MIHLNKKKITMKQILITSRQLLDEGFYNVEIGYRTLHWRCDEIQTQTMKL